MAALWALRVMTLVSAVALLPAAVLWWLTLRECFHRYLARSDAPGAAEIVAYWGELLAGVLPGSAGPWTRDALGSVGAFVRYLVNLDLSSCSALVVLLVVAYLAIRGWRYSVRLPRSERREGYDFWEHSYGLRLFPAWLSPLSIQLGLIGTLISFVLAALLQLGDLSGPPPAGPPDGPPARAQAAAPGRGAGAPALPDASRRSSHEVFLLLCAALVSTLVGCLAAYLVIPPLEWLNGASLGRHQRARVADPSAAASALGAKFSELTDRLQKVIERAGGLDGTLGALEALGRKLGSAAASVPDLGKTLESLTRAVGTLNDTLTATGQGLSEAARKAGLAAAGLEKAEKVLAGLAASLAAPLKSLGDLASQAGQAEKDLAAMAKGVQQPIGAVAQVLQYALDALRTVADSLARLTQAQEAEGGSVKRVADCFDSLNEKLGALLGDVRREVNALMQRHEALEARVPTPPPNDDDRLGRIETLLGDVKGALETFTEKAEQAAAAAAANQAAFDALGEGAEAIEQTAAAATPGDRSGPPRRWGLPRLTAILRWLRGRTGNHRGPDHPAGKPSD